MMAEAGVTLVEDDRDKSPPSSSPGTRTPMSIDLSNVPGLIAPSPASNTLLITNLNDPVIFEAAPLLSLRQLIHDAAPLHSFAPLRSLRRIVASFYSVEEAVHLRQLLDGESVMGERVRVYYGEPTPIAPADQHLAAPKSQRLFFISPPPSPPHGWTMRNEEPPNKAVHADDLASALAQLQAHHDASMWHRHPLDGIVDKGRTRSKHARNSSSTVVYDPEEHGDNPLLPAVTVEDLTEAADADDDDDFDMDTPGQTKILAHTARPPVELMQDL